MKVLCFYRNLRKSLIVILGCFLYFAMVGCSGSDESPAGRSCEVDACFASEPSYCQGDVLVECYHDGLCGRWVRSPCPGGGLCRDAQCFPVVCTPHSEGELCGNRVDDDCDGEVDEGFEALSRTCEVGRGACATSGVWVCDPESNALVCNAELTSPTEELCNGLDDDCDGDIDEDFDLATDSLHCGTCGYVCPGRFETCQEGLCMYEEVRVEPGTFQMGPGEDERISYDLGAQPLDVSVTLTRPISAQVCEVTGSQWEHVMGEPSPGPFRACGPDCPVAGVTWYEAVKFLNRLSERHGLTPCYELQECSYVIASGCGLPGTLPTPSTLCQRLECAHDVSFRGLSCDGYRLPTVAEFEYMTRAGSETGLPDNGFVTHWITKPLDPIVDRFAWYQATSEVEYVWEIPYVDNAEVRSRRTQELSCGFTQSRQCGPSPVGRKAPNALGLYDVLGNLEEWTHDPRPARLILPEVDPVYFAGQNTSGIPYATASGGSFRDIARKQLAWESQLMDRYRVESSVGFRPVRTLPTQEEETP